MSTPTEVRLPDIGDFSDVPVIEVHVAAGDTVAADDPILTLESDKATMDVPSPVAGTVGEVLVGVGDRVSQGDLLLRVDAAGAAGVPARSGSTRARRRPPASRPATGRPAASTSGWR
jgi:pyruvate/2-oxoglutarate dehydrogenase complex dihydrolipoamide acyltransferase (E2) component